MKVKTNTQIKIYHSENTSPETIRSNANELSIALSRLDNPWAITFDEKRVALTAYCYKESRGAVVIPPLQGITGVRLTSVTSTLSLPEVLITSERV